MECYTASTTRFFVSLHRRLHRPPAGSGCAGSTKRHFGAASGLPSSQIVCRCDCDSVLALKYVGVKPDCVVSDLFENRPTAPSHVNEWSIPDGRRLTFLPGRCHSLACASGRWPCSIKERCNLRRHRGSHNWRFAEGNALLSRDRNPSHSPICRARRCSNDAGCAVGPGNSLVPRRRGVPRPVQHQQEYMSMTVPSAHPVF